MPRKIPRGKGYDKAATLNHLKKMVQGGVFVTQYVKDNGLKLDLFMLAASTYGAPELNHHLVAGDPKLIHQNCEECGSDYWPSRRGARFCSSSCANTARRDKDYFGGKRRTTAGLAERVCGLCQRTVERKLSSHHIYGKGNDPENNHLLALCSGCHQMVSDLALKKWCTNTGALERLIVLACSQRDGALWIGKRTDGEQLSVSVSFSVLDLNQPS